MILDDYIAAWRAHDAAAILATIDPGCVVIESYGPVYRGHAWVERWVDAWLAEGGRVLDWIIRDRHAAGNIETAEWTFHYIWRGEEKRFDGSTIARLRGRRIAYLREYATTAPLYDWRGAWR